MDPVSLLVGAGCGFAFGVGITFIATRWRRSRAASATKARPAGLLSGMPIGDIPDLPRQRSYGEPPRPAPARSAAAPSGAAGRGREDGERLTDLLLASRRLAQDAELRLTRAAEANLPPPRPVDNPAPTTVPSASSLLEISRRLTEDARMRLARDEERG